MGNAEMSYSLGATSHTETKSVTLEEGDCDNILAFARCHWKVALGGLYASSVRLHLFHPKLLVCDGRRPWKNSTKSGLSQDHHATQG
jgi:hypothetical protein